MIPHPSEDWSTLLRTALSPIIKPSLDLITEYYGIQPTPDNLSSRADNGDMRILFPVGRGKYDSISYIHMTEMDGEITYDQLVQRAKAGIPKTTIERCAPHMIENEHYVYVVDQFIQHFKWGRARWLSQNCIQYFWIYSAKLSFDQIVYRLRRSLSRIFSRRAEGIPKNAKNRSTGGKVKIYGALKATAEFFRKASDLLLKYSDGLIYKSETEKKSVAAPKSKKEVETKQRAVLAKMLEVAKESQDEPLFDRANSALRLFFEDLFPTTIPIMKKSGPPDSSG